MAFFLFSIFLASLWTVSSQATDSKILETSTVDVFSTPLQGQREIVQTPYATIVTVHPSVQTTAEATRALPGVSVREYSGPGSLSNISAAESFNAGETKARIEGTPIPDPLGTGLNILLIPPIALERIEQPSPLSGHTEPGGEIDFRLLSPTQNHSPSQWKSHLRFGSGLSEQAAFAYRTQNWAAALHFSSTDGHYTYQDPRNGHSMTRLNNDAKTGGALFKTKTTLGKSGKLEAFHLISFSGRTNPGTLNFPTNTRENEVLGVLGARLSSNLSEGSGLSTAFSATLSRTKITEAEASLVKGTAFQTGYSFENNSLQFNLSLDHEYSSLAWGNDVFSRHQLAITARPSLRIIPILDTGEVRALSFLKAKKSSTFQPTLDLGLGLIANLDAHRNAFVSYGYLHSLPNLPALHGYSSHGFTLLPNPNLTVERDHVVSAGITQQAQNSSLNASSYYRQAKNQPTFASLSEQVGQTLNINQSRTWGILLDGQTQHFSRLELRASLHASSSRDLKTDLRLPYKANFQALVSATYLVWSPAKLSLTAEEEYLSSRFADTQNARLLPQHWLTHVGAECIIFGEKLSFKVRNLWNTSGYVTDGFPLMGRSFWLGYQFGGTR